MYFSGRASYYCCSFAAAVVAGLIMCVDNGVRNLRYRFFALRFACCFAVELRRGATYQLNTHTRGSAITTSQKPLCWVPYYNLEYRSAGQLTVCCKIDEQDTQVRALTSLEDFHSEEQQAWRRQHFESSDQLPRFCSSCSQPPGVDTYRTINSDYLSTINSLTPSTDQPQIRKLLMAMDNICASSCVMCSPKFSHTIARLVSEEDPEWVKDSLGSSDAVTVESDLTSLADRVGNLQTVVVFGGEPLFSPRMPQLIDILDQHATQLTNVIIVTGLNRINTRTLEQLSQWRQRRSGLKISVTVSMDADPRLNAWQRGLPESEFDRGWQLLQHYDFKPWALQVTATAVSVLGAVPFAQWINQQPSSAWADGKPPTIRIFPQQVPQLALRPWNTLPEVKQRIIDQLRNTKLESSWWPNYQHTVISYLDRPSDGRQYTLDQIDRACRLARLRGETVTYRDLVRDYLALDL